jgi:serine O-acetyltransferase
VTLGAKSFPVDAGRRGAVVGGNVWVTRDVPPGARVTQARPRQVEFSDGGGI